MAYQLSWSLIARDDLREIIRFISFDSPQRAQSFAVRLIAKTDSLPDFPKMGKRVPETRDDSIRELIFRPYRIVYRVDHKRQTIEIARVWHAARGSLELPD